MIKIIGNKDYTIYYDCDCGVKGQCMVKPLSDKNAMIVDIKCPICMATERIKLQASKDADTSELSWACIIYNEVTDYEVKEDLYDNDVG
jgi:hypothetical protein